jgi:hypothetical protein
MLTIDAADADGYPGQRRRTCPARERHSYHHTPWYLHRPTSSLGLLIKSNGAEEYRIACTVCRTTVTVLTHRAARHLIRHGWTVDWVRDNRPEELTTTNRGGTHTQK